MNDRIKQAFGQIHAEETLKKSTLEYIETRRRKMPVFRNPAYKRLVPVAACILFAVTGLSGCKMYFTTTSVISMDINPSVELNVNRFDRVISCDGLNDDGSSLLDSLNLRFKNYSDAVQMIMEEESIQECLARDEEMSIVVVGDDQVQNQEMVSVIESCTSGQKNTYCCSVNSEEVSEAHDHGLSYGKYKALLDLQEEDPDITAEDIEGMTMREIHELMHEDDACEDETPAEGQTDQQEHHQEHENGKANGGKHNSGNQGECPDA